ncbi:40S ribosomal protein S5-1 [Hordeum vulgare]|nr:40S ribosomal protein S5-1 [Hordeum vulgare]
MRKGMLHIRDVEGPKKTGSVETRLEAMEQQVFQCQRMVERGLNANHMMITEFTNKHRIDANDIGKHLSRLYDRIDQLQAQIYDLQNQNWKAMYYDASLDEEYGSMELDQMIEDVFFDSLDSDEEVDMIMLTGMQEEIDWQVQHILNFKGSVKERRVISGDRVCEARLL